MNIKIDKKDDIILKILHYFITEEDYKPVIINGLENEIWLENMENDLQLIRINTNYIHNDEQLKTDIYKAKTIMKSIKKSTLSLNINLLNLLLDTGDSVSFNDIDTKGIETINARVVLVAYPYSDTSEMIHDLNYAKQEGKVINIYLPNR